MTIMNIASSPEENISRSKLKTEALTSPSVLLSQPHNVQQKQKGKKRKREAAKCETPSSNAKESKVKNEKYFQVEESFAQSFGSTNNNSFSLLSLFGSHTVPEEQQSDEDKELETKKQCQPSVENSQNNEKHHDKHIKSQQHKKKSAVTDCPAPAKTVAMTSSIKETVQPPERPLFFTSGDSRLSDGVEYFQCKLSSEELWEKWSAGFKNDVRNLYIPRQKRRNEDLNLMKTKLSVENSKK
ncbi:uncharacterized protein LOC115232651 [Argonauta hians]